MSCRQPSGALTAVLPCNDLDASERFYNRLCFSRPECERPAAGEPDAYRMLSNGLGGHLHLTSAEAGWLLPGRNPFGLYLYFEDVDGLALEFKDELRGGTVRKTSPGACMSLRCPIPTRRWFASAGRRSCGGAA
jgi:hypothetical protein